MNRIRTADEVKREYADAMGEPLGKQFHALWQEVAWLHVKWEEYLELFGTKPSRIELLNKAAPRFFGIVQDLLWEETILHIARLTDPAKSKKKKNRSNLTIYVLPDLIDDLDFRVSIEDAITVAKDKTAFCRDWRNRRIAHRDLRLAIEEGAKPLPPTSRADIRAAIASIDAVLITMTRHYMDTETRFDIVKRAEGAEALLYVLDDGLRADAEREDRIRRGEYLEEDIAIRDL